MAIRIMKDIVNYKMIAFIKAKVGIEPALTALQAAA